jgi:hypothetical protein
MADTNSLVDEMIDADPCLQTHRSPLVHRLANMRGLRQRITKDAKDLLDPASGHEYFGLHRTADGNGNRPETVGCLERRLMKRDHRSGAIGAVCLLLLFITAWVPLAAGGGQTNDLTIVDRWNGDFAVVDLALLPKGQRQSSIGYIDGQKNFAAVWQAFKPGETIPAVDFKRNLVVFSRNVDFYNQTRIFKITLSGSSAEIMAMETMSAMPIEDKVAMAMAVIPRTGVKFIRAGAQQIPVPDKQ